MVDKYSRLFEIDFLSFFFSIEYRSTDRSIILKIKKFYGQQREQRKMHTQTEKIKLK